MALTARASDRRRLSTAAALIAKAEGSPFGAEQHALALRAYTELAAYLNSVESLNPGARRRERRLFDRRGGVSPEAAPEGAAGAAGDHRGARNHGGAGRHGPAAGPESARADPARGRTDSAAPPVIDLQVLQARSAYRAAAPRRTPMGVRVNVGL